MIQDSRLSLRVARALLALVVSVVGASAPVFASPVFSQLVLIGDSLSDTGNMYAATGGFMPSAPYYYDGRYSNGPVSADYLAARLGLSGSQVHNYAVSGAYTGTDNAVFHDPLYKDLPPIAGADLPGMRTQLDRYMATNLVDASALYVVWGGPNDFAALMRDPSSPPAAYTAAVIEAVTNIAVITQTLVMSGAQHVLVANMPNLGRTPGAVAAGPAAVGAATGLSLGFNAALSGALDSIDALAPGRVDRFDTFGFLEGVIADADSLGLANISEGCLATACAVTPSDWSKYLFWDWEHPTTRVHEMLADGLYTAAVPEPGVIGLAALGFVALWLQRRRVWSAGQSNRSC
ncbi:SGNH/GDSL hydrolase family protein [Niveibacterium umoris]|uniref:Phospholipase/lecithinase/hemolysin n=1 Tax=Niveibacterium umoris TaxID=1193620 RepID=A0A840BGX2_9RHOO|nr:SGNH/GDSL hydrolase family protein [Niveibacterium umoris]MBB4012435.1 phospholipase/lecithinase/hemolysin [Niveibacterium umoris]